ncbi:MAG: class I SAM-dependent methyltransferase [Bryobacteraceae bacterium]|jgi:O-antigen chain-terminating methyltransferase
MSSDAERIEELTAIVQTVRERVRSRYPQAGNGDAESGGPEVDRRAIRIPITDLLPIVYARDAAQAKIAAIGSVNPRAGGIFNNLIQFVKRTIARSLQWFVRDQVTFNRETVAAIESVLDALTDHNRILLSLAAQSNERIGAVRGEAITEMRADLRVEVEGLKAEDAELRGDVAELRAETGGIKGEIAELRADGAWFKQEAAGFKQEVTELKDIRKHWIEWRADWEHKLAVNEIQFLRGVADLQAAFQHRLTLMESNFRETVRSQHADYLGALDRTTLGIQKRLWEDMEKIRADYERLIYVELRLIRQRSPMQRPFPPVETAPQPITAAQPSALNFDYGRFAERFRGSEDYVRRHQEFYKPFFEGRSNVLDIGCGRGEFLETMRDLGVPGRGIDLSEESVEQCRRKGLEAERADLFDYLAAQPDGEFDGIMSSQVVEHLAPERLPLMIRLCASKMRRGGLLVVETPNPECLAIFATHFYLDPTHTRPVPHQLMAFYLEEAGFAASGVHPLSPAIESMPELAELPEHFREKFFGGLDYAIMGRKL